MTPDSCILVCGRDGTLITTRSLVLESAGFRVRAALSTEAVIEALLVDAFDLAVLCHTLSPQDCLGVLAVIHSQQPNAKILSLQANKVPCEANGKGQVVNIFDGPGKLVEKVQELIIAKPSAKEPGSQLTPQVV